MAKLCRTRFLLNLLKMPEIGGNCRIVLCPSGSGQGLIFNP
jgi:hypothetical protein